MPGYLLKALDDVGYETPSPIQSATIPPLLEGKDLIGMAQTGTGKTAAFALPVLSRIDLSIKRPQALVLCPTRELAIQVSEAFQSYASYLRDFHVLPVYGGQDMRGQLRSLKRGVHVIVGTPGRLIDHLDRRSMDLSGLRTLVLDEADEMLRMGFIEDVEVILNKTPPERQIALFSATMPAPIRKVAEKYIPDAKEVRIKSAVTTNENIEQSYWLVSGTNKLDALTRILEVEDFDGMIIFVRTKTATADLADKLNARGFSAAALNGDMNQSLRVRTIEQLKKNKLDIVIATDVAARGLDVERITHVVNYDIPYDDEAYVHRIGRTGRAGRTGKAILFVAPRERRLLKSIERTTGRAITPMELPSQDVLIDKRSQALKASIASATNMENKAFFQKIVGELCHELESSPEEVATTLLYLLQKDRPLFPAKEPKNTRKTRERNNDDFSPSGEKRRQRKTRSVPAPDDLGIASPLKDFPDIDMERFKIHVGHSDEVSPREIVGAIANEADIEGKYIGHIKIYDAFSTVDLPTGMPKTILSTLRKTRVRQKPLNIERLGKGTGNSSDTDIKMSEKKVSEKSEKKAKRSPKKRKAPK